jgi:tetratricopeptide (TPR) repeat protein
MRRALLVAAVAALVYLGALANPFAYDDWHTVLLNPSIRSLGNLRWIVIGSPRWLVNLSYAVDFARAGARPFAFHLTNVLLHAANALLVLQIGRKLVDDNVGFWAAMLFAVHPLQSETVGYVASRPGLMCLTFVALGVLAFERALAGGRRRWLGAAAGAWILGVACKESAAMLPLVYLALDRLLAVGDAAARRRRLLGFHAPLFAVSALAVALRLQRFLGREHGALRPAWQQLGTQAIVVWRYLGLFVAPVGQSVFHAVDPIGSPLDARAWLALAALAALAWAVARRRRQAPAFAFGAVWFALFLAPSSLAPLDHPMAEHRVYEASPGLFLCAAIAWARLPARAPRWLVPSLLVCALGAATVHRTRVWHTNVRLWQEAVERAPRAWEPRYALADARRDAGDCRAAVDDYQAAIAMRPGEPRARQNLGICLAELGRLDEAERSFRVALELAPDAPSLHHDLGLVLLKRDRPDEARAQLLEAARLDPGYPRPRRELAALYQQRYHMPDEALRWCDEARRLVPDAPESEACKQAAAEVHAGGPREP